MSRLARHPTRAQSWHLLSTLSFAVFALLALVSFSPAVVNAEEAHPEYGTVIGIGVYLSIAFYHHQCSSISDTDLGTT